MKLKYVFALCVSLVCVFLAGCGDKVENTSLSDSGKDKAVTSDTKITTKPAGELSGKVTSSVTTKKAPDNTAVSETTVQNAVTAAENADNNSKSDDSQAIQQSPDADQQNNDQAGHDDHDIPSQQEPSKQASFDESDFSFTYNGHSVVVGENINGFTDSVAPNSHFSAPTCLGNGEGENHTYTYSSFTIIAYKSSDSMTVTGIDITGEDVSTVKNIKINSSVSDLVNAYGDGYEKQGSDYVYSIGKRSIRFSVSGDKVTYISYNYDME